MLFTFIVLSPSFINVKTKNKAVLMCVNTSREKKSYSALNCFSLRKSVKAWWGCSVVWRMTIPFLLNRCPVLMNYVCPICGASGKVAHTIRYCPKNKDDRYHDNFAPITLLKGMRSSTGKTRMADNVESWMEPPTSVQVRSLYYVNLKTFLRLGLLGTVHK